MNESFHAGVERCFQHISCSLHCHASLGFLRTRIPVCEVEDKVTAPGRAFYFIAGGHISPNQLDGKPSNSARPREVADKYSHVRALLSHQSLDQASPNETGPARD